MSDTKQIKPNHADHISGYKEKWLNELYNSEPVIAQPKYDGERMLIHFDNSNVYCTSRRISKKTNEYMRNDDKLQMLVEDYSNNASLNYTVLDCECYAKNWSEVVGVLHSLPERAAELQKTVIVKYAIFDCLWYDGKDVSELPYLKRLEFAMKVIESLNIRNMHLTQFINDEFEANSIKNAHFFKSIAEQETAMENAVNAGFEGIVVKSLNKTYRDKGASLKCKKFETVDCVVYDYVQGKGKYSDTIGALKIGYYNDGNIVHVTNVNCSTDAVRYMWSQHWDTLKGRVIEVKCQEVTSTSLRHPVYIRLREDKSAEMCTKDTIFKEK